jgi:hypothetical protein
MRERPVTESAALADDRLPTLTEVVEWAAAAPRPTAQPLAAAGCEVSLSAEVLFELDSRIQAHFETRLREALAPALARAADGLIRDARLELSGALRDLVEEAVTRAIERRTHG